MKKYKIGNRIITADSATKALEIHKLLDSISDSKVEDSDQTDIFNEIKSKYPGVKFVNVAYEKENFEGKTIADFSFNIIGNLPNGLNRFDLTKKEPFERFVKWVMEKHGYRQVNVSTDSFRNELRVIAGGFKSIKDSICDESIEELSEEEKKAIEDYRKAIEGTTDPKLLELFAHILKEETEHLEELQNAKEGEFEDSIKDYYDGEVIKIGNEEYILRKKYGNWMLDERKTHDRVADFDDLIEAQHALNAWIKAGRIYELNDSCEDR